MRGPDEHYPAPCRLHPQEQAQGRFRGGAARRDSSPSRPDGLNPDTLVVYDDNGRSGSRLLLTKRRGYHLLMEAAQRDEISVVYARVIDRLGRDTEEGLRLYRVLQGARRRHR